MKRCNKPDRLAAVLLAACIVLLSACTSAPPSAPVVAMHPLEQNAMNAVANNLSDHARTHLEAALAHYHSVDDLLGQWRVRHQQILLDMKTGNRATATTNLAALQTLAQLINTPGVHYATLLQSGRVLEEDQYYERAAQYAVTDTQRAVIKAYLGEVDVARTLIEQASPADSADKAFVLYRYAQAQQSVAAYQAALQAYRVASDSRGIADTLVSLARLELDNGNPTKAKSYATRAQRALNAAGDTQRAAVVRSWLETL